MKFRLLTTLIASMLVMVSCGEDIDQNSETVDIVPFASSVTKGSPAGTNVPDPLDETKDRVIAGDFANFNLAITNNNEKALVVTSIDAEIVDYNDGGKVKEESYPAQAFEHCALYFPDSQSGGRFFAFLPNTASNKSANLGSHNNSLFYIQNLVEDEFGRYKVEVTLTVKGFFTDEVPDPGEKDNGAGGTEPDNPLNCGDFKSLERDPYIKNVGPFKKIIFFQLF